MTALNIISPREPLTDPKTGLITRSWWRFFETLFQYLGGYAANVTLTDVEALAFSEFGPSGSDYSTDIAEQETLIMLEPSLEGRIAAIETRLRSIENVLADISSQSPDLQPLQTKIADLTAWAMGT